MLKRPEGNKNEAETPAQIHFAHVLFDQLQTVLSRGGKACGLAAGNCQHSVGEISAGHVQSALGKRQRNAPRAATEFQHRPAGFVGKTLIESDITGNLRRFAMIECVVGPNEERSGVLVERVQARLRAMLLFSPLNLAGECRSTRNESNQTGHGLLA
jgi:hypothetical protein